MTMRIPDPSAALFDASARKKATNVTVNSDLLAKARALGINLSASLEAALADELRRRRAEDWLAENRAAIEAYNGEVASRGVFSEGLPRVLMAQFAVYRNPNPETRGRFPLLLDVQSPLLDGLATCVVVPLAPVDRQQPAPPIARLMPLLDIGADRYVMVVPQLAGVSRKALGPVAGDASGQRVAIVAALDLLFTGV